LLLRLSGEICDQIQLGAVTHRSYVQWAIKQIHIGAKRAGRDPKTIPIMGHILTCIDDDPQKAKALVKPMLGRYLAVIEDIMFIGTGITANDLAPIKAAYKQGGEAAAAREVTNKMVEKVGAVGTAEDVIKGIERLQDTGLTIPLLWGQLGEDQPHAVVRLGQEILPHIPRSK
jgi:5,10-methylenetetrahydromethanopterin reductase